MSDPSQHVQYGASPAVKRRVFLTYTAAVSAGYPVCYEFGSVNTYQNVTDSAIGLSTPADSRRICVDKPDVFNNNHFAGVIAHDYAANTAGQWIEIYPPGEICDIKIASTTLAKPQVTVSPYRSTGQLLTFGVGKWYFKKPGFPGSGSALTLQMITGANTCRAELQSGPQSGGYQEMLIYSGTVTVMISAANAITRGGVTEILSAVDGTNATKAAATTHYTLSDGDYVGQRKLLIVDTTVGYSVFEFIISIPKATQHTTTGPAAHILEHDIARVAGRLLFSTTIAETAPGYMDATWTGHAWRVHASADKIS